MIVRDILRRRFVEMPFFIACGNLAWEFVWSVPFSPNSGLLFAWLYRSAFVLDLFIFANLLRYGQKQIGTPELLRCWRVLCAVLVAAWVALCVLLRHRRPGRRHRRHIGLHPQPVHLRALLPALLPRPRPALLLAPRGLDAHAGHRADHRLGLADVPRSNCFVHTLGVFCFLLDCLFIALLHAERGRSAAGAVLAARSGTRSTSRVMSS